MTQTDTPPKPDPQATQDVNPLEPQIISRTWDEYVPTWKDLRSLGQSKIVNSAILMPLIGYYILYGESYEAYFQLNSSLDPAPQTNIALLDCFLTLNRTNLFYFGLWSISIAAVLFTIFCPPLVRDFRDYADYLSRGVGKRSVYNLEFLVREILKMKAMRYSYYQNWAGNIALSFGNVFHSRGKAGSLQNPEHTDDPKTGLKSSHPEFLDEAVEAVMLLHYSVNSWSKFGMRVICTFLYIAGFVLVTLSALQILILVIVTVVQ